MSEYAKRSADGDIRHLRDIIVQLKHERTLLERAFAETEEEANTLRAQLSKSRGSSDTLHASLRHRVTELEGTVKHQQQTVVSHFGSFHARSW